MNHSEFASEGKPQNYRSIFFLELFTLIFHVYFIYSYPRSAAAVNSWTMPDRRSEPVSLTAVLTVVPDITQSGGIYKCAPSNVFMFLQ